MKICICIGSSCHLKGTEKVIERLQQLIKENKLIILSIILLIGLIAFDYVLIKNFIKLLMIL